MLENKRINMILSLLIAIALWAFVIGEVNPEATRVYRDIPIHLIHESALDESNLAVLSSSDVSLTVTISGTRSEVNQIREKDIVATVDLSQAVIGENQLRIDIKVPSKVEVESQSIDKVTVIIENMISKEVPVKVRYKGSFSGEEEPITIEQSMETISVTGAETNIGRVSHVEAVAEEGVVTEEETTFDCRLVPVDVNTSRVYNVDLPVSTIAVTAELAKTKTVPLEVPIVEDRTLQLERTITVPETITLKGRNADLESIEGVTAETIDVSKITESTTLEIVPILPENVEVSSETEPLIANVQVVHSQSKSLTVSSDKITVENLNADYEADILTGAVQVTIVGSQDVVSQITEADLILTIDAKGRSAGTYTMTVSASCKTTGVDVSCEPQKIKVKLTKSASGDSSQSGEADDQKHNSDKDKTENNNDNTDDNEINQDENIEE